jgi:hypothetical protein
LENECVSRAKAKMIPIKAGTYPLGRKVGRFAFRTGTYHVGAEEGR